MDGGAPARGGASDGSALGEEGAAAACWHWQARKGGRREGATAEGGLVQAGMIRFIGEGNGRNGHVDWH